MDSNYEEMLYNSECSDSEYEVIVVNPNINYESDDDSGMEEESSHNSNCLPKQLEIKANQEIDVKIVKKVEVVVKEVEVIVQEDEEVSNDSITPTVEDENSMSSTDSMNCLKKVRRKLNLAEYKMRRANEQPQQPLFDIPRKVAAFELCDTPATLPLLILPTDPIWIKHNQRGLKQEADNLSKSSVANFNPNHYEEITSLSMGCNTDITIPPNNQAVDSNDRLSNIVGNLKKDNMESLLNSSTSLFSSIQAVVHGKCVSTETEIIEGPKESSEHGEDKIIMYLRKDRLRPFKCSAGTQTDSVSLFPPLLLTPSIVLSRPRSRNYRRKTPRSRSRSRSASMEYDRVRYNSKYSRSQHSTHSSSMNSSESDSSDSESDSNYNSSSDSLKRFNDRQNFKFYNRNQNQGYRLQGEFVVKRCRYSDENSSVVFIGERRIIYIGGLEGETTKDEIRRKFLNYGTIKKISLHAKENG